MGPLKSEYCELGRGLGLGTISAEIEKGKRERERRKGREDLDGEYWLIGLLEDQFRRTLRRLLCDCHFLLNQNAQRARHPFGLRRAIMTAAKKVRHQASSGGDHISEKNGVG